MKKIILSLLLILNSGFIYSKIMISHELLYSNCGLSQIEMDELSKMVT